MRMNIEFAKNGDFIVTDAAEGGEVLATGNKVGCAGYRYRVTWASTYVDGFWSLASACYWLVQMHVYPNRDFLITVKASDVLASPTPISRDPIVVEDDRSQNRVLRERRANNFSLTNER